MCFWGREAVCDHSCSNLYLPIHPTSPGSLASQGDCCEPTHQFERKTYSRYTAPFFLSTEKWGAGCPDVWAMGVGSINLSTGCASTAYLPMIWVYSEIIVLQNSISGSKENQDQIAWIDYECIKDKKGKSNQIDKLTMTSKWINFDKTVNSIQL